MKISFIQEVLQDLSTTVLAVVTGMILFSQLNFFHRILFFQVVFYLAIDLIALWIKPDNNQWLYNVYMPVEMGLILLASWHALKRTTGKRYLYGIYLVFCAVFILDIFWLTGYDGFAKNAAIAEGFLISGILLYVIFTISMKTGRRSVVFSCTGMAMYFSCIVPYLGIMFYVDKKDVIVSDKLFEYVIITASLLRYFCVMIGFILCLGETKKQAALPINEWK